MLRRVRAGFAAEKGAAMVELAISIVVLATLLMGVIEFGRVMQTQVGSTTGLESAPATARRGWPSATAPSELQ